MTGEHVTRQSPKGLLYDFVGEGLGTRRGEVLDSLLNKIISQDRKSWLRVITKRLKP